MVLDPDLIVILQLCYGISSIGYCGHSMEEFCAFIPKFDSILSVSILPVCVSGPEQFGKLSLYD